MIVGMLTAAGLYLTLQLSQAPRRALERSRDLMRDIREVATAFRSSSIETQFTSFASTLEGTSYLQFATLEQVEEFTLTDRASIFWGTVELPEVVVSATAPVVYTAYLDLDARWDFVLEGRTISVTAPEIRFNKPAIDASEIRYEIRRDSLLRDEDAALQMLKQALTEMSRRRATELLPQVREIGRRKTEQFVTNWLVQTFDDGGEYEVQVRFADEPDARKSHPANE
ncbi:MAG: hypothetical protein P8Y44_13725 [Acidobacteriota bacterium]